MRIGDLTFVRSTGLVPWLLRRITGGTYNHVMINLGEGKFVSADQGRGVHYAKLADYPNAKFAFCRVLSASDLQAKSAAAWAEQQIGGQYDTLGLTGIWLRFAVQALERRGFVSFWGKSKIADQSGYFCSELATEAYLRQGVDICQLNPTYVSPTDLFQAPCVSIIEEI